MRKEVIVLRQVVTKLVPMLAERNIRVTQQGIKAFVASDRRGRPVRVNIPYIPDNASDELIAAIQGFVDHEVGHLLFSDFDVVVKANAMGERIARIHNAVEDTFVERGMAHRFRGSQFNLNQVYDFYLTGPTERRLKSFSSGTAPEVYAGALFVPMIRAMAGQPVFVDFMKDRWGLIGPIGDDLRARFADKLKKVESSEDCLNLAILIERRLEELKPTPPEMDEDEDDDSRGDRDDDGESKSDDGEGKSGSKRKASTDEDRWEEDEKDAPGDEETEESESAGGGSDEDGDKSDGDSGEDDDVGDSDDIDDDMPVEDGDSRDEDSDEDSAGGGLEDGDAGGGGDRVGGDDSIPEEDPGEILADGERVLDSMKGDFEDDIADDIAKDVVDASRDADYLVFTRDYDHVETYNKGEKDPSELEDKTGQMVGVMQKDLERAMAAVSRAVFTAGWRSGRIHGPALHRLRTGDPRVFRRRQEARSKDVAVSLLADCSGSMGGGWGGHESRYRLAIMSAFALSQTLERIGIDHEAIGFTTWTYGDSGCVGKAEKERKEAERALSREYSRYESIYMPIFKGFDERLTPNVRMRFGHAYDNEAYLANNIDGECVEIAAKRVLDRRKTRSVLIVLSDGAPCAAGNTAEQSIHLKRVVGEIEKMGVETVGIGIQTRSVESYYPRNIVLNNIEELPALVMGELRKLLIR